MNSKEFYDMTARKYDLRHSNATARHIRKTEEELIKRFSFGKALDIGCGTGQYLSLLEKFIGTDISLPMLKGAEKKHAHNLVHAPAENLPFKKNSFDTILCLFTVLNLCDFQKTVKEMRRVLKKNGLAIISVASVWDKENKTLVKRLGNPEPKTKNVRIEGFRLVFHLFSKGELIELFRNNGFSLEHFKGMFILQKPYWGWFRSFSIFEKSKLWSEKVFPFNKLDKAARLYFAVFRKS